MWARRCNVVKLHLLLRRPLGQSGHATRARNVLEDPLLPFAGEPIAGDPARAHALLCLL